MLQETAAGRGSAQNCEDGAADEGPEGQEMSRQQSADDDDGRWGGGRGCHRLHPPSLEASVSIIYVTSIPLS